MDKTILYLTIFGIVTLASIVSTIIHRKGLDDILQSIIRRSILSAFVSGVIWIIVGTYQVAVMDTYEAPSTIQKLKALETNMDISGSSSMMFFVGSGYVEQSLYYYFYVETENGIQFRKERAEDVYLREYDGPPKYMEYSKFLKKEYDGKYAFYHDYSIGSEIKRVLYIPKGTILTDFNVDLE